MNKPKIKTAVLVRHAKSSWDNPGHSDKERPLTSRGKTDAAIMANVLKEKGLIPEAIFSSPARRAQDTAAIFCREMALDSDNLISLSEGLYFSGMEGIFETLQTAPDPAKTVFTFSHNPDLENLAGWLSHGKIRRLPTCGLLVIEFMIESWAGAAIENAQLLLVDFPSQHR